MMIHDKKRAISTIMAARAPQGAEAAEEQAEKPMDLRHQAAMDLMNAIKDGDHERVSQALANHHDLHVNAKELKPE